MADILSYTSGRPQRRRPWRRIVGVTGLLLIALCYAAAWLFGRGAEGEFSPDTLQSRYRSELLLPLTRVPLYRSGYTYTTDPLVAFLVANGYWTPLKAESPSWVHLFRENAQWWDGHGPLYRLIWRDGQAMIAWSKANPTLAGHVWPKVLQSLRSGQPHSQHEIVLMLSVAQASTSPVDFDHRWQELADKLNGKSP